MRLLARFLEAMNQPGRALGVLEDVYDRAVAEFGPDHPLTVVAAEELEAASTGETSPRD